MTRSLSPRQTANLTADLRRILGFTTVGGRRWSNLILTAHRTVDWQNPTVPTGGGPRGGTSTATETAERVEDRKVARQADRDHHDLAGLIVAFQAELVIASVGGAPTRELAQVAERLAQIVVRHTQPIDHTRLPADIPECRSCARPGKVGGRRYEGHKGIDVYEKAKKHGLCRWCYDHATADAKSKGRKGIGALPPVDVIDILHTRGPRAAGLELARRYERKAS